MVASSHDAVLTSALDGTIVTWNAGSLHLYGYSAEEAVGHPVSMLLAPGHAAEWRAVMDRIGRAESPDPFDTVCVRKDGMHLDVALSVSPLADGHGRLVGAAAFSHDITAHMQTVADLRRTLAQLIESQGLARLGSWEWDIPTNTMRWSEDLYRLYGVNPAEGMHPNALDLVHPDDRTLVRDSIDRACREGGSYVCEHRVVRTDGSIRWWENRGTALPDAHGNPLKLFGTVKDISEQKRRDQALAHHGALIESSDDAIITKSLDGTILSWSPGAERLYGYRAEEVVGHPLSIIVPADRPGEVEAILQRITRGEHVAQHETVQVRKDGTRLDISMSVSPIKDTRGKLIAASAIARDITEWKHVAEALARSRAQLRDFAGRLRSASEKERSFIAREIHDELGQALTALKMDLFSLRNGLPASARARLEPETTEMAALIDVMVDKVRTLAAELRPRCSTTSGWPPPLNGRCSNFPAVRGSAARSTCRPVIWSSTPTARSTCSASCRKPSRTSPGTRKRAALTCTCG